MDRTMRPGASRERATVEASGAYGSLPSGQGKQRHKRYVYDMMANQQ